MEGHSRLADMATQSQSGTILDISRNRKPSHMEFRKYNYHRMDVRLVLNYIIWRIVEIKCMRINLAFKEVLHYIIYNFSIHPKNHS